MIELQPGGVVFVKAFLAVTIGIIVLFAGKAINARVGALREYNIPEPVTGGLLFALLLWILALTSGYRVTFELTTRDVLLVYFFTAIGVDAKLSDLKSGGRPLIILIVLVVFFTVLQDVVGVAVATLLGRPPALGLLTGSVAMVGGHGTAIAFAPLFATEHGISNALEVGVLAATAGLVMASLLGGPVAQFVITRHRLRGPAGEAPTVGVHYGAATPAIDYLSFLRAVLAIHVSAAAGILLYQALKAVGVDLPLFLTSMTAAIVFTNVLPRVAPRVQWPSGSLSLALISEISLGVFLAMSLMSMELWTLANLAGVLLVLLLAQATVGVLFTVFVVFPALTRTYDAAVISSGFLGFGLGATPTAMANMTAVTQRHGASHVAFLVVPLVGAFFSSVVNAFVIQLFLAFL